MKNAPTANADACVAAEAADLLATLADWVARGWLRRLDAAFARFIGELDPAAPPAVLLAAALLSHLEGLGHSCLPLTELLDEEPGARARLLGWGDDALAALAEALPRVGLVQMPTDASGLGSWEHRLAASRAVDRYEAQVHADEEHSNGRPLVLAGTRLYLRRYRRLEQRLARHILQRCEAADPFDEAAAREQLSRLFPPADTTPAAAPSADGFDWQRAACALALGSRLTVITGGPGTGKTHTAARLLALLASAAADPAGFRIALAAPTGKAAARLRHSIASALLALPAGMPCGTAAELAPRIGPARTLHALLGTRPGTRRFAHHAARPLALDLLIVDEASMVHLEMMTALLDALPPSAHLVLLGDKDQLASVEAGAVLADLCAGAEAVRWQPATAARLQRLTGQALAPEWVDATGSPLLQRTVMLRHSHRFGGAIGELAKAIHAGNSAAATALALSGDHEATVKWISSATPADAVAAACGTAATAATAAASAAAAGVAGYRAAMALVTAGLAGVHADTDTDADSGACTGTGTDIDMDTTAIALSAHHAWVAQVLQALDRVRVLCAVREGDWGVAGLNGAIEAALRDQGCIGRGGPWYAGRPVMVLRNDPALDVVNGDVGVVLPGWDADSVAAEEASRPLRVWFVDGTGGVRSVGTHRLREVATAFAITVHKSQGSEFDHVVLVLPPDGGRAAARELLYTGVTRARQTLTLITAQPGDLAAAVRQQSQRSSGLAELLAQDHTAP